MDDLTTCKSVHRNILRLKPTAVQNSDFDAESALGDNRGPGEPITYYGEHVNGAVPTLKCMHLEQEASESRRWSFFRQGTRNGVVEVLNCASIALMRTVGACIRHDERHACGGPATWQMLRKHTAPAPPVRIWGCSCNAMLQGASMP